MSNEVKRYDPINSDGTCGMCIEDADYGAYVEYADYAALEAELATVKKVAYGNMELLDENRNLQAELAKLRAGQEPVAWRMWNGKTWRFCYSDAHGKRGWEALYTAPQPSEVPDDYLIVPIQPTEEMRKRAQDYLAAEGMIVSDWLVHTAYTEMLAAAPSAPATVQGVNTQLLEALENTATWIEKLPVPTVGAAGQLVKIDKAIAAAQEGGKV